VRILWSDQRGAALLEYSPLMALITLAVLAVIVTLGAWTSATRVIFS
jgi:Flp pilus assembly pilin Flp